MRAISTVLDASLCLLFVTASALTLVGTPLDSEPGRSADADADSNLKPDTADDIAEMLTTTTAQVTYAVGDSNRTAHDTLAGLLATAALMDAESASTISFQQAVTARVSHALRRSVEARQHSDVAFQRSDVPLRRFGVGVQVVAEPIPDRNSALGGRVVAGDAPPPTADVHAAVVEVRRVRLTVRTWSR